MPACWTKLAFLEHFPWQVPTQSPNSAYFPSFLFTPLRLAFVSFAVKNWSSSLSPWLLAIHRLTMGPHLAAPISSMWHGDNSLLRNTIFHQALGSPHLLLVATPHQEPGSVQQGDLYNPYTTKYSPSLRSLLFGSTLTPLAMQSTMRSYAQTAHKCMSIDRTSPITSIISLSSRLLPTCSTSSKWASFKMLCTFQTQAYTFFCGHTSFICPLGFLTYPFQVLISKIISWSSGSAAQQLRARSTCLHSNPEHTNACCMTSRK